MNFDPRFSEENAMTRAPGIRGKPKFHSKLPPATLEDLAIARKLKDFGKYSGKNQTTLDSESEFPQTGSSEVVKSYPHAPKLEDVQQTSNHSPDPQNKNSPSNSDDVTSSESPEQIKEDSEEEDWGIQGLTTPAVSRPKTTTRAAKNKNRGNAGNRTMATGFVVHLEPNPTKSQYSKRTYGLLWTELGDAVFDHSAPLISGKLILAGMIVTARIEKYDADKPATVIRTFDIIESQDFQVESGTDSYNPKLIVSLLVGENSHSDMTSFFLRHSLCGFIRIGVDHAKGQGNRILRVLIQRLQNPLMVPDSCPSGPQKQDQPKMCYWEVEKVVTASEGQRLQDSEFPTSSDIQNPMENLRIQDDPRNYGHPEKIQNPDLDSGQIQNPRTLWNSGSFGQDSGRVHPNFPGTGRTCSSPSSSSAQVSENQY